MPTLQIRLLGDFRLIFVGTLVTTVVQARLQALLAYLLLHRDSPQLRRRIAFLFWPGTAESQALTNLRQLLHHLSKALPDFNHFLKVETKTLHWRLDADYSLDVADFERELAIAAEAAKEARAGVERTALESAVDYYRGDLLPGCYDDWILPERERLSQLYLWALERLILLAKGQRDYPSAIVYGERLLRYDPLHETTYRHLMRLYALHGDRASALRVYHNCVTILARELGVEPGVDTQHVYKRLLNMETPALFTDQSTSISLARSDLVGRKDEWNLLRNEWRHASAGRASMVLISGEAGIGKTRLAEEFLEWAYRQGITTARTRSYAAEGRLAYAPVTELLRTDPLCTRLYRMEDVWLAELARLMPEILDELPDLPNPEPITENWQRKRLFEALSRAVLIGKGPLLLLLDDLQWCDQDTLEWLHYLLHIDSESKLLILGGVRPEEVDQAHPLTTLLLDLRRREQVSEIELRPLDAGDSKTLAEQIAGMELDAVLASRLYRYTEGNPLFVVETIREEVRSGQAGHTTIELTNPVTKQQPISSTKLPTKIRAVIQARLGQLSPSARELAGIAATIGRAFTSQVLAHASESGEETLVLALDELWRRRIVREQGRDAYDFSHDRIREVAYAEVSSARRKVFHKRVAIALEKVYESNLNAVSGQIAVHYDQAGRVERAIDYYLRAAIVAQQTFSNADASSLLSSAMSLLPLLPDSPERAQTELKLLIGLGTALMPLKGNGHPEVEQVLLRAWDISRRLGAREKVVPVLAALWICNNLKGDIAQQVVWAEHLEREARSTSNAELKIIACFALAGTALFRGDFLASRQNADLGLAGFDPMQFGSQRFIFGIEPGIALIPGLAMSLWLLGYPDEARKKVQFGLELAFQSTQPATIAAVLGMGTVVHQWCGEVPLTLDQTVATMDYAREKDMPQWIAHSQMLHGWALGHVGQLNSGIAELRQGLAAWQGMGAGLSMTYYSLLLAELLTISGQLKEGISIVEEALKIVDKGGESWMEAELNRRKGELLLAGEADNQEVEACFQRAMEIARHQKTRSFELRAATSLSRLWQRQGKHTLAQEMLAECYNWFTEGFDTSDLLQAKTQLDSLLVNPRPPSPA